MTIRVWSSVDMNATGRKLKKIIDRFPGNHDDYYVTSSHRPHTPGSHHGGQLWYGGSRTSAIDIGFNYGSSGYQNRAREFAQWLYKYSSDIVELISTIGNGGYYVKNQSRVGGYAVSTHRDHIHFATSNELADELLRRIPKLEENEPEPPRRDDLYMADFTWFSTHEPVKLNKDQTTAIRWHNGNNKKVSESNPYTTFVFQNKNFTGTVAGRVVAFDEDGNFATPVYRVQMGKVDGAVSGDAEPFVLFNGMVFQTSEFSLSLDEIVGDGHRLRLYITPLVDGVEWRSAKLTGWQWK